MAVLHFCQNEPNKRYEQKYETKYGEIFVCVSVDLMKHINCTIHVLIMVS